MDFFGELSLEVAKDLLCNQDMKVYASSSLTLPHGLY